MNPTDTHLSTDPSGSIGNQPVDTSISSSGAASGKIPLVPAPGTVQGAPVIGNVTAPSAIPTDTLSTPQNPIQLPTTTPTNTAAALSAKAGAIGDASAQAATIQAQLDAKTATDQTTATASKSAYESIKNAIFGVQSGQAQAETDAGIADKTQAVTDATNALNASKQAQSVELQNLYKTPGLSTEAVQSAAAEINRRYAFDQSNLAVVQSAANNDLNTASNLVAHKIQLQLEPLQTALQYTQDVYNNDNNTFDKDQDVALQNLISTQKETLATETANKNAIGNLSLDVLKSGQTIPPAVLQQLDNAKDQVDAEQILMKAGISLKTASTAKTGTADERAASAISKFTNAFNTPNQTLKNGIPLLDANGQITPEAWKEAIDEAPAEGLSRTDFIKAFGGKIYTGDSSNPVSSKYGLTPTEIKLITG